MKLIGNIEVSGIKRIVFYNTGEAWIRSEPDINGNNIYWFLEDDFNCEKIRDHDTMMKIVHRKIWDPLMWRIWIHGETMNIQPVETDE